MVSQAPSCRSTSAIRQADPETPEPYPQLVAALIQGAAENLGLVWRADPGAVSEDEALAILAGFFWGGISALGAGAAGAEAV